MATAFFPTQKRIRDEDDLYPDSDGKPMAESDLHFEQMVYNVKALKIHFASDLNVYIAGNNFLYWERGNPRAAISPDCYAVFGVEKRLRRTYMAWKENEILPSVVIEVTSKKTKREDTLKKRPIYEQILKVPEYFQFDPTGDYLKPRLQGVRMVNGVYEAVPLVNQRLYSEVLGLDLVWEGERMRFFDPITQKFLLSHEEDAQRANDEADARRFVEMELRAEVEEKAALAEENERLRAELEAFRKQLGQQG